MVASFATNEAEMLRELENKMLKICFLYKYKFFTTIIITLLPQTPRPPRETINYCTRTQSKLYHVTLMNDVGKMIMNITMEITMGIFIEIKSDTNKVTVHYYL